jgi:glycosyltransferase involved in cell wall biosynthesis
MLRVVNIAEDLTPAAGGVPAVVRQLSERLSRSGVRVQIVHATGEPGELPPGVEVFSFPPVGLRRLWSWGDGLQDGLARLAMSDNGDVPVFHVHGAWSAPQYFCARIAHLAGVPFVFTAHGMLEPWLWDQQGWKVRAKKRAYWSAMAFPVLSKASVIHAITPLEQEHLARLFPNNHIEVIPNAIDVDDAVDCLQNERGKTILFLGRIEPKKGVDLLLRAFSRSKISKEWSLDIVGPA